MTALRATLAGVVGLDGDELSAVPLGLVLKLLPEPLPALLEDCPVRAGLLLNVLAGFFDCTFGRACHVSDASVLYANDLVFLAVPISAGRVITTVSFHLILDVKAALQIAGMGGP